MSRRDPSSFSASLRLSGKYLVAFGASLAALALALLAR